MVTCVTAEEYTTWQSSRAGRAGMVVSDLTLALPTVAIDEITSSCVGAAAFLLARVAEGGSLGWTACSCHWCQRRAQHV